MSFSKVSILAKTLWTFLLLGFVCIAGLNILFLNTSYDILVDFIILLFNREDIRALLQNHFLTLNKFNNLQILGKFLVPVFTFTSLTWWYYRQKIISIFKKCSQYFINIIKKALLSAYVKSPTIRIALYTFIILYLSVIIYTICTLPIQYDEAWNYNYFLGSSFFTSLIAYNNYPFYNLFASSLLALVPDSTISLRLPALILSLFNGLLFFSLIKNIFKNETIAFIGLLIFMFTPTIFFYTILSRGILMGLLFGQIILFYFYVKTPAQWSRNDLTFVCIFGALSCFAMISFPLFIVSLTASYLLVPKTTKRAKVNVVLFLFFSGIGAILLYLPMFLGSGFGLALNSDFTFAIKDIYTFMGYINHTSEAQLGFEYAVPFFLAVNFVSFWIVPQRRHLSLLNILLLLLPAILPITLNTFLPGRGLSMMIFSYSFTILMIFEWTFNRSKNIKTYILFTTILISQLFILINHPYFHEVKENDKDSYEIAQILMAHKIDTYYSTSLDFYYNVPAILFYHNIKNKSLYYKTINPKSTRFLPLSKFKGQCFIVDQNNYAHKNNDVILKTFDSFYLILRHKIDNHK